MAEVAIGLFSALSAGAASAATAVGTGLAGAASAVGTGLTGLTAAGSSALGILQGVATVASVASTLVGGIGSAAEAETNARLAQISGDADALATQQKILDIKRDLAVKTGEARVAFAGSGLDISSASAVEGNLQDEADYQTAIEQQNAIQQKQMAALRASQYRSSGAVDLISASAKAIGQAGGYGLDIAKRG
ncbi:hypothetical protein [Hyphomicrobium sp. DY-1]|uniref:hypothetical protein n=1 Tax=Hyphomicrobium sp. DY-1 TaxID=3075650 RepID=UPI0039C3D13C